ncbi:BTAD domain-containing putative transcriptional regulator [Actinoplanes sp. Pm04-4]|uniref:BTAD domain-containing putative transcriptional regulator n=1 Tax=Paractinoplanes pyxinae TaxID=2997416 RepID=A0ABT4B7G8_9ACTN|nr:BTAD domain-containing putative transcriptional regulator [Actinoplanes pyxinae]MCY1141553.1 BTAD domain-containing putative transcriptional regulator [Actinoplanes pyxinae]
MFRLIAVVRRALAAALFLIGVPCAFAVAGGIPRRMPSVQHIRAWAQAPLDPGQVATTVWIAAWLVWAALAALVMAAVARRVAQVRWDRMITRLPAPMQGLAATVLGATALTAPLTAAAAQAAPAPVSAGSTLDLASAARDGNQPAPQAADTPVSRDLRDAGPDRVVVRKGDTLSSIAEQCLGDADLWPKIFALNRGTYFDDVGGRLTDPDRIYPGWILQLPTSTDIPDRQPPRPGVGTPQPGPPPADSAPETAPPTSASPDATATPSSTAQPGAETTGPVATTGPGGATAPGSPPANDPHPADTPSRHDGAQGVRLASGSWLDAGLAGAIAVAAALIWKHRRRRYHRRPLSPDLRLDDPDMAAMPPAVTEIRRRLRVSLEPTSTAPSATATTLVPLSPAAPDRDSEHEVTGGEAEHHTSQAAETGQTRPNVPTLTHPAAVTWPAAGLGLIGPGAGAAARGFLAAALADIGSAAPPGQVLLPATTAAALLGDAAPTLPPESRVSVTADLAQALHLLEQQTLQRSRLLAEHDADTIAAVRSADPHEQPAPPILLLADPTDDADRTRIAAVLTQGQRLDIHGILLGAWPDGDTVVVDADGFTTPAPASSGPPIELGRISVLTQDDTLTLLNVLTEAHTGRPQPDARPGSPAPTTTSDRHVATAGNQPAQVLTALAQLGEASAAAVAVHLEMAYPAATAELVQQEHAGHTETVRTDTGRTVWRLTDAGRAFLADTAETSADATTTTSTPDTGIAGSSEGRYAEVDTALRWPDGDTIFTSELPPDAAAADDRKPGRVEVTVLGPAGIVATKPDRTPRRKAIELLVYLAVHDGSATVDAILDDLMPDAPASKAPERLYTYVSDLRAVMRRIGGPATYVTHPRGRYALNTDTISIDLWRMRAAIRDAQQTTNPQQRITALHRVIELYRGPLAADTDYEWAEPYREAIRQQALDAHLALADALTHDPLARAQVLEAAITHSPYSEQLYQQAMRTRAELGHLDAIRTLRRDLTRALAEIDTEPDDQTLTLADQLTAQTPPRK